MVQDVYVRRKCPPEDVERTRIRHEAVLDQQQSVGKMDDGLLPRGAGVIEKVQDFLPAVGGQGHVGIIEKNLTI